MSTASPWLVSGVSNSGKYSDWPALLKTDAEISRLTPCPRYCDVDTCALRSPKLSVSTVTRSGSYSTGDLVTMLMVANMPLVPYSADEGPRMISIRLIRSRSSPKSWPKKVGRVQDVFGERMTVDHHQKTCVVITGQARNRGLQHSDKRGRSSHTCHARPPELRPAFGSRAAGCLRR